MKSKDMLGISVFAAVIAIIILQLILPAVVSSFSSSLSKMDVVSAVSLVSWFGILIMMLSFIGGFLILSKRYLFSKMFVLLIWATFLTAFLLVSGSFLYLYFKAPELFSKTLWMRVLHVLDYPALVSLHLENPQPIWVFSIILLVLIFDLSFFYITGGKNK